MWWWVAGRRAVLAQGRAGLAQGRAGIRSASASNPVRQHDVFQLEVTPCFVVCPLCFAF